MDRHQLSFHVENIRNQSPNAIGDLAIIGSEFVNQRLDFALNRGFTNAQWETILQPFVSRIHDDPSFAPDGDVRLFLYRLARPIMREAVRHYYVHGEYPIGGIVEYESYRKKVQFAHWFYTSF